MSDRKTQSDRFIETARKLGADKDAEALDRVFGKVVPPVVPEAKRAPGPAYRVAPGGTALEKDQWAVVRAATDEAPHPTPVAYFATEAEAEAEAERRNVLAGE